MLDHSTLKAIESKGLATMERFLPHEPTPAARLLDRIAPITTTTLGETNNAEWEIRGDFIRQIVDIEAEAVIAAKDRRLERQAYLAYLYLNIVTCPKCLLPSAQGYICPCGYDGSSDD